MSEYTLTRSFYEYGFDLFFDYIVPPIALDWFFVSKEWHLVAQKNILSDNRIEKSLGRALQYATVYQSVLLLKLLMTHPRSKEFLTLDYYNYIICFNLDNYYAKIYKNIPKPQFGFTPEPFWKEDQDRIEQIIRILAVKIAPDDTTSMHILTWAARKNRLALFKDFLTASQLGQMQSYDLLRSASKSGSVDIVQYILTTNDLFKKLPDYLINEAIQKAAENGKTDVVKIFLNVGQGLYNISTRALSLAAKYGHEDIVRLLLEYDGLVVKNHKSDPQIDYEAVDCAAYGGNINIIRLLIDHPKFSVTENGLAMAAQNNKIDAVKFLLEDQRVDPSSLTNKALREAVSNGFPNIVKILLDDDRTDPNEYCLEKAIEKKDKEIIRLLLACPRLKIDAMTDAKKFLQRPIFAGDTEMVQFLMQDPRLSHVPDPNLGMKLATAFPEYNVVYWKQRAILQDS